jgi:hypothetical protein
MNASIRKGGATTFQRIQNLYAGAIQLSFPSPRAGSLDEVWMLLHQL